MTKSECSKCINDKFYIDADTDDAECVECGRQYPANDRIYERTVMDIEKIREQSKAKFLMHHGDF